MDLISRNEAFETLALSFIGNGEGATSQAGAGMKRFGSGPALL